MLLPGILTDRLPHLNSPLVLSLGLSLGLVAPLLAAPERVGTVQPPQSAAIAQQASPNSPLADGSYLFGQSPQPEQLGQEYLVFEVRGGKVMGAFYMPQSEFSCFSGTIDSRYMKLSVIDPYDNTAYPYAIALQELSAIATAGGQLSRRVGLEGYQQIPNLSNLDRHILGICLNDVEIK